MITIKTFFFKYIKGDDTLALTIKSKDYGDFILCDVFYQNVFLLTISDKGKVLLTNWEIAREDPIYLDDEMLNAIREFIRHEILISSATPVNEVKE